MPVEEVKLTKYWLDHYTKKGKCSLCANKGFIDTRKMAGEYGDVHYCICPNGQLMRHHANGLGAEKHPRRLIIIAAIFLAVLAALFDSARPVNGCEISWSGVMEDCK